MSLDIAEASIVIDWLISKICGDTLPSDDIIDWMFRTYEWLIRYEGGYSRFVERRPLIFPTESNFPIRQHSGDLLAHEVFELVRRHAQLTDFKFQLVPQSEDPRSRLGILGGAFKGAAGTYVMDYDGVVTITYQSKLLDDIPALISVLAHELCHYYLRTGPGQPPDGDQAEEYATDLAVTFLGFGIFQVNTVYKTVRTVDGTSYSHKGYLGELPCSYALAIFTSLHKINPGDVMAILRPNPASYYQSALRDLKKRKQYAWRLESLMH